MNDKENNKNIWDEVRKEIEKSNLDENIKKKIFQNLLKIKMEKINILITGATGCGKSSTINALLI